MSEDNHEEVFTLEITRDRIIGAVTFVPSDLTPILIFSYRHENIDNV